jgi:cGAMP-activated phospholipase
MGNGKRFQALSISGGGFRGLYTASVLAALEESGGRPLGQCFEIIAGTSIGGIIALALGFEVPMQKVVEVFRSCGHKVFPGESVGSSFGRLRRAWKTYKAPEYENGPVREILESLLGTEARLGDSKHPLLIPAVNLTEGQPQVFKTRHHRDFDRDWRLSAVDIGLATSAAPTFFTPVRIDECLYADGGVFANSPDLVAYHEATHFLKQAKDDVWMLSVGTTTQKYSIVDSPERRYGTAFWVVDDEHRLPNVLISAQQQFAEQIAKHLLDERYIRIDATPSHEQASHLGLDKATDIAASTLQGLGMKDGTDVRTTAPVRGFLAHDAQDLLWRETK